MRRHYGASVLPAADVLRVSMVNKRRWRGSNGRDNGTMALALNFGFG
jgi:hypothetical protein